MKVFCIKEMTIMKINVLKAYIFIYMYWNTLLEVANWLLVTMY
jgi:hypothetical protein